MDRGRTFRAFAALLAAAAILWGCNAFEGVADDTSREAQLEAARIAMDEGDFPGAVRILEGLNAAWPGDTEIDRALASAYAGRAGLDFLGLAARVQEASDNASVSRASALVSSFPHPVTDAMLSDAERAVSLGRVLAGVTGEKDDWYRLAIAEIARAALTLLKGTDLLDDTVSPAVPGTDGMPDTFHDTSAFTDPMTQVVYSSLDNAAIHLGPGYADLLSGDLVDSTVEVRDAIRNKDGNPGNGATAADVRAYLAEDVAW